MLACGGAPTAKSEASAEKPPATDATEAKPEAGPAATNIVFEDIKFSPFNPKQPNGIHVFPVMGNPGKGAFTAIVRFPDGFMTPLHSHDHAYSGVALSDGLVHGSTTAADAKPVPKGSAWNQPAGEPHVDGCKGQPYCYFMVFFEGAVNMVPEKSASEKPAAQMMPVGDIQWKEVKGGVKMAMIKGNPKEGGFVAMFEFPAGMSTNVHTHSASFAGALVFGSHQRGPSADKLVTLTEGSVWHTPANAPHMEKCGSERSCVMVGTFDGPLDVKNVEIVPAAAAPEAPAAQ